MKRSGLQLYTKILIGLAAGVLFGVLAGAVGWSGFVSDWIRPVGTAFVRLIGMVVVPLVFASLLIGVAGLDDVRKLGRIGAKTVVYYLCTTAVAISIGLLLANTFKPGMGLDPEVREQLRSNATVSQPESSGEKPAIKDVLLDIIPTNPIRAFVEGRMLQIIFFALFAGVCLTLIPPERSRPVVTFFEGVNDLIVKMVHIIMWLAPYGVFALIAAVVADFGLDILLALLKYSVVTVVGLVLHMVIIYSVTVRLLGRMKPGQFFRAIRPAQLIAFSTSSSSATLPVTMECVEENLGVPRDVSSFVLPLGATINMDGSALYQGVSALFLAQMYNMDLGLRQQLAIVVTATLASIGTAGTPGAGIITLAIVLKSVGIPLEGIGLIWGVERILDMCRSTVNITGDASCAVVVSAGERTVPSSDVSS